MTIIATITKYLRQLGLLSPLGFDQQVWGAKTLMDLDQTGSKFYLAEANAGGIMYTCWQGSLTQQPYAITIDTAGHTTGPTPDSSKIGDCMAFAYPPTLSCSTAQQAMTQAGIEDAWAFCRLRKTVEATSNPFYDFAFATRNPVYVDAMTGKVTQT